jgi:hypothetical protein
VEGGGAVVGTGCPVRGAGGGGDGAALDGSGVASCNGCRGAVSSGAAGGVGAGGVGGLNACSGTPYACY